MYQSEIFTVLKMDFMCRNTTLKCLTEVGSVSVTQYDSVLVTMYSHLIKTLEVMLPLDTNIRRAYSRGMNEEQQFIQDLVF